MIEYLVYVGFISFFLISILKKELPAGDRLLKGKRAVFVSLFFLIILLPLAFNEIENFSWIQFLTSFVVVFPVMIFIHKFSAHPGLFWERIAPHKGTQQGINPYAFIFGKIVVPENIPPRKVVASNLILWGFVGAFIGLFFSFFIYLLVASFGASNILAAVAGALVFIITVIFISYRGSRTRWM